MGDPSFAARYKGGNFAVTAVVKGLKVSTTHDTLQDRCLYHTYSLACRSEPLPVVFMNKINQYPNGG